MGLAEIIKADPLPPLEQEVIVVQSRAMARWLSLVLADTIGIWAGGRFLFPNAMVKSIFDAVIPDLTRRPYFDRESATWILMEIIERAENLPEITCLSRYITDTWNKIGPWSGNAISNLHTTKDARKASVSRTKLFKLARTMANLFDQYLVYRPELIEKWERYGDPGQWQAWLWQRLKEKAGLGNRAAMLKECLNRLGTKTAFNDLPRRMNIFGIASLPPFHLALIEALAEIIDVNLFFMNPSRYFWADIRQPASMDYQAEASPYAEHGNRLLASMGQPGRDFFYALTEAGAQWEEAFLAPEGQGLLGALQGLILDCKDPEGDTNNTLDESIVIHSCHSPIRELEVLQDHLLALFDKDPSLEPRDILVMAPDIKIYAPLIPAVFDLEKHDPRRIPYTISGHETPEESLLFEHLLRLLDTLAGRFPANAVMDLLGCQALRRRFAILETDLPAIEKWIEEAGIRWGIDEEDKEELGLPPIRENTWRAGLDRLLLTWSMEGCSRPFKGIFPIYSMDEDMWEMAGRFLDLLETLFRLRDIIKKEHSPGRWADVLEEILETLYLPDPGEEAALQLLRSNIKRLREIQEDSGFEGKVGVQVILEWLRYQLAEVGSTQGFFSGGVTFSSMLPMREIPFKVICLLGINDDEFPRPSAHSSFDLMSRAPRPGDRSQRADDRYMFLEAILSARRQLYISFVGQSARDNSEIPPSVLVTDLVDYLEEMCTGQDATEEERQAFRDKIIIRHRLQPFSPYYFTPDSRLVSYSLENFEGAHALLSPARDEPSFLKGLPLYPTPAQEQVISLEALVEFFTAPAKFFCTRILGLKLQSLTQSLEDREPFVLDGLGAFRLKSFISEHYEGGVARQILCDLSRACGLLPHGTPGSVIFTRVLNEFEELAGQVEHIAGKEMLRREIRIDVGNYRICSTLKVCRNGLVYHRYAKTKAKDLVRAWIKHVFLCRFLELDPEALAITCPKTYVLGTEECHCFEPLEDPSRILKELLSLYLSGISRPLPFFPETSFAYAKKMAATGDQSAALHKASSIWEGNAFLSFSEASDAYHQLCYRGKNPLDACFKETAQVFWGPVLESMTRKDVEST